MVALPPSGTQYTLRHGAQRATAVEVGGGIREYTVAGHHVLDGYGEDEMCTVGRGQLLIPWPNRLRDGRYSFAGEELRCALTEPGRGHAIHGLVRWQSWTAVARTDDRVVLRHRLNPQPGYPFCLVITVEHRLDEDGLSVRTATTNAGGAPCPYGSGAHPYITVGTDGIDDCLLQLPATRRLVLDERAIPTGATEPVEETPYDFRAPRRLGEVRMDDALTGLVRDGSGRAIVELGHPDGGRSVQVWMDETFPYVMAFTGDAIPDRRRRRQGLGVEPMTCAPNAFASGEGLRVLEPGETVVSTWGVRPVGRWEG